MEITPQKCNLTLSIEIRQTYARDTNLSKTILDPDRSPDHSLDLMDCSTSCESLMQIGSLLYK